MKATNYAVSKQSHMGGVFSKQTVVLRPGPWQAFLTSLISYAMSDPRLITHYTRPNPHSMHRMLVQRYCLLVETKPHKIG